MMAEARRIRDHPEQAMQGSAGARHRIAQGRRDADQPQPLHGQAQALGHAFGGTAGRRGQRDPWQCLVRLHRLHRLRGQQYQQPRDGGGLAGAGAAGHQHQRMAQRDGRSAGLVIDPIAGLREQLAEQRGQGAGIGFGQRMGGDALQALGKPTFVFAVATQIQQPILQHQRRVRGRRAGRTGQVHPGRGAQLRQPRLRIGPVGRSFDQPLRLARVEPGMALGDRQGSQCGRHQYRLGGVRAQTAQAYRQCVVQGAQGGVALERGEQAHASPRARAAMRAWACPPPANRASSASTRAGSKRCAYRPGLSSRRASRPRQNR
ncbi:hypothetical protein D3C71_999340 [compost metagenome]